MPASLRHGRYAGAEKLGTSVGYRYSHAAPDGVPEQRYPPDAPVGKDHYRPTEDGGERTLHERLARLRGAVRGG